MTRLSREIFEALLAFFAALAGLVIFSPGVRVLDAWAETFFASIRTPLGLRVFESITVLGSPTFVAVIVSIVTLALVFSRYRTYLRSFLLTFFGAVSSVFVVKDLVERVRPSGLIPAFIEPGFSFPSGHATISIALYGFLAFLACRLYPRYKRLFIAVAVTLALGIGVSRLYLGVHYPSDVIAGYALGALWLLIGIAVGKRA